MHKTSRIMIISMVVNTFLSIIKFVTGILTYSNALIAEGIDSIMDLINNIIAFIAIKKSHDPADEEHPFGHGKVEYVASLILATIVIFVGFTLFTSLFEEFNDVSKVPKITSIYVLVVATIIKAVLATFLKKKGLEHDNQLIYSLGVENFSDILRSGVVFIGIILTILSTSLDIEILNKGDSIAGLIISGYIMYNGFVILKESITNLLGKSQNIDVINGFKSEIEKHDGVIEVTAIDIVKHGPFNQVLVSVAVDPSLSVYEGHVIATNVKDDLIKKDNVNYIMVHIDPYEGDNQDA